MVTILNITGSLNKIRAIYVLMTLFYTFFSFVFIFFYWKRSLLFRYRQHSHSHPHFEDHDIALHSLKLRNLPQEIPFSKME